MREHVPPNMVAKLKGISSFEGEMRNLPAGATALDCIPGGGALSGGLDQGAAARRG